MRVDCFGYARRSLFLLIVCLGWLGLRERNVKPNVTNANEKSGFNYDELIDSYHFVYMADQSEARLGKGSSIWPC